MADIAEKRRVKVRQRCTFTLGHQTITKTPEQVIDDPHTIDLLEKNGIELVDLDRNGRPTLSPKQADKVEAERNARIDALASALDLPPTTLREALDKGGYNATTAVREAVQDIHTREIRASLKLASDRVAELEARVVELETQSAGSAADVPGSGKTGKGKSAASSVPSSSDLTG